jgi:cytochrome c-type biogenesis protein CcmH/NrfG
MNISVAIGVICTVSLLTILPVPCYALTPAQVFDKVKDAVVVVKTIDAQGEVKAQGSGVLISSGRVATNCHVGEGGSSYRVGQGRKIFFATLYAENSDKDICLLDVKGIQGRRAQLGKAARLKVGDPVYAVGAPQGLELSLSGGMVAQLRGGPAPLIQTTAAISPGSSGGGLFDGEGRLVGLTTFYIEGGQNLNFAMPAEWIGEVKPGHKPAAEGGSHAEWLKRAIALETKEDWQGLLDLSLKWTQNEPNNASAWFNLGIAYKHLDRYDDAFEAFRQSVRIEGNAFFAWLGLGAAYNDLHRYNDAIGAYRQAIRIDPQDADAWSYLGSTYYDLHRYDDAIGAYRQAIRLKPDVANAWYGLGYTYFLTGNKTAALGAVRELQRLNPEQADKLFNLITPR